MTTEVAVELRRRPRRRRDGQVRAARRPVGFTDDPSGETVTFGERRGHRPPARAGRRDHAQRRRDPAGADWPVTVPAGGVDELGWLLDVTDRGGVVVAARGPGLAADAITDRWPVAGRRGPPAGAVAAALAARPRRARGWPTARHRTTPSSPPGSPWYLTLFGRDSLWAARLLLPVEPVRPAGRCAPWPRCRHPRSTCAPPEQPGKIMHELRRGTFALNATSLPPLYYGTIDATPLWVCLLHDAWRAGLAEAEVRGPAAGAGGRAPLAGDLRGRRRRRLRGVPRRQRPRPGQPGVEGLRRLRPLRRRPDRRGPGRALRGAGLRVRGRHRRRGAAGGVRPAGAERLPHVGRPRWPRSSARRSGAARASDGSPRWPWTAASSGSTPSPATSGTCWAPGCSTPRRSAWWPAGSPSADLDSGLGLRTMSDRDGGYSPLSYHCGSVWPHDTAIVIAGLARAGPRRARRPAWPRGCSGPRRPSTSGCPSSGAARAGRCPTRRPAARRPGRPRRRSWSPRGRALASRSIGRSDDEHPVTQPNRDDDKAASHLGSEPAPADNDEVVAPSERASSCRYATWAPRRDHSPRRPPARPHPLRLDHDRGDRRSRLVGPERHRRPARRIAVGGADPARRSSRARPRRRPPRSRGPPLRRQHRHRLRRSLRHRRRAPRPSPPPAETNGRARSRRPAPPHGPRRPRASPGRPAEPSRPTPAKSKPRAPAT